MDGEISQALNVFSFPLNLNYCRAHFSYRLVVEYKLGVRAQIQSQIISGDLLILLFAKAPHPAAGEIKYSS